MNSCIFTTRMQEPLGTKEAVEDNELSLQLVEEIVQEALIWRMINCREEHDCDQGIVAQYIELKSF